MDVPPQQRVYLKNLQAGIASCLGVSGLAENPHFDLWRFEGDHIFFPGALGGEKRNAKNWTWTCLPTCLLCDYWFVLFACCVAGFPRFPSVSLGALASEESGTKLAQWPNVKRVERATRPMLSF